MNSEEIKSEKQLSIEEIAGLKTVGIVAENWFAVCYNENSMPFALFSNEEYATAYRNKFSATSIVMPWPMIVKDYRKFNSLPSLTTTKENPSSGNPALH